MARNLLIVEVPDASNKGMVTIRLRPIDCFFLSFESAEHMVPGGFDHRPEVLLHPWGTEAYPLLRAKKEKARLERRMEHPRYGEGQKNREGGATRLFIPQLEQFCPAIMASAGE